MASTPGPEFDSRARKAPPDGPAGPEAYSAGCSLRSRQTMRPERLIPSGITRSKPLPLLWPDGADFDPLRFAVAALSRVDDDVSGMGWLVAHGVSPSFRGRHNGASMRPGHGAVPCARRGETREGIARPARSGATEGWGHPRVGHSPCPAGVRCAVGFADRGSLLGVVAREGETSGSRPRTYPVIVEAAMKTATEARQGRATGVVCWVLGLSP